MQWTEQRSFFLNRLSLWPSAKTQSFASRERGNINYYINNLYWDRQQGNHRAVSEAGEERTSLAKPITCLGMKNNTLLLGPHLSTPGRILIVLGKPPKYSLAKRKKDIKIIFRNRCPQNYQKLLLQRMGKRRRQRQLNPHLHLPCSFPNNKR